VNVAGGDDAAATWLRRHVAAGRMPGATWHVAARSGVVSRGAVGVVSTEGPARPTAEDTVYDLASLTKPLATALLALLAARAGRLQLIDPARRWLPELASSPYAEATLLELGTHRAGLPAWRPLYLRGADRAAYLAAIAAEPPAAERGRELYSDLSYLALGFAVERALDDGLAALFRDRIAAPLGLRRTGFADAPGRWSEAAPTERGNAYERALAGAAGEAYRGWRESTIRGEVHDVNAHALGGAAGHAGLFGTADEVAAIARCWIDERPLGLTRADRGLLLRPRHGGAQRTFGLVVSAGSTAARDVLPPDAVGHVGFTGTSAWVVPDASATIVLLSNRVHPTVSPEDFQPVRAGFHRAALAAIEAAGAGRRTP